MQCRRFVLNAFLIAVCLSLLQNDVSRGQLRSGKDSSDKGADAALREQTIYIPYAKLREIFEREGRGVFLPYEKFQELWTAAQEKLTKPETTKPPVGALIAELENEAVVERDVVNVTAKLKVELITEGWHTLGLRLNDVAIRSAKVGDRPARVTFDPKQGHQLLLEKRGTEPEMAEVLIDYSKSFTKSPGRNSVSFQTPAAPVNRWRVRIPQTGVKVNIEPLIAATESPAAQDANAAKETTLLAFVGAAPEVRIDWTPKSEGAAGLEALSSVQAQHEVFVDEGSMRNRVRLSYAISRAELTQLSFEVPADHKVSGIFDSNVRQWDVKAAEGVQTVTVQLFEPARTKQDLVVELEKLGDDLLERDLAIPMVKAVGAGRQQGFIVVGLGNELRGEIARRRGLLQLDTAELPQNLAGGKWSFAFRYASPAFDLALRVEKVLPLVRGEELVEVYVEPEQITVNLFAVFDIERAGVFQFEFDLPTGYTLRSVRGREGAGAVAATIENHQVEGNPPKKLRVNLPRKAMGKIGVWIELHRRMNDPNLLSPTGNRSALPIELPRIVNESVERRTGRLIVYSPESLLLNPTKSEGLSVITYQEAIQNLPSTRDGKFGTSREVLAYAFSQQPVDLSLDIERRRHQITARQLLVARIEPGVVKFQATFTYDILYSSVKSLRIDVPTALAARINLQPSSVRKAVAEPAPADLAEGYVAWNLSGATEFIGTSQIVLDWENETQELDVGKSLTIPIPVLEPRQVDRAWGQAVVVKAETLDVVPAEGHSGLRPIDPQYDLMPGSSVSDAALAFEFHDKWSLSMNATRYKLEETKRTSIDRSVVRAITTMSGQVSVQALYRVRSALQRLAVQLPAQFQLDTDPFRINGRPIPLERGTSDDFLIPLTGQSPDQPFLLELRYTVPGDGAKLDYPVFPDSSDTNGGAAVQKVYMCTYLPLKRVLLGSEGPWEDEIANPWFSRLGALPQTQHSDTELVNWVREGINLPSDPMQSFPIQGQLYVFSTLRPPEPPQGALQLFTFDRTFFYGILYGGLGLVGVVFARSRVPTKLAVLGILLVAILLVGVFQPMLALQVINEPLFVGLAAMVAVWAICELSMSWSKWWNRPAAVSGPAVVSPIPRSEPATSDIVLQSTGSDGTGGESAPAGDSKTEGGSNHENN